ncbi:MAG: McrC family protein [Syntrophorhabdaceae bacterium]|nr:McrC family protein [Syntrophorhabdaceae bacterium]
MKKQVLPRTTTMMVKDNTARSKIEFSAIPNLTKQIADKTIEQLEKEGVFVFPGHIRESDDITDNQMILQSTNESFRTSNVMGFLGMGRERLTIQSRFSNGDQDFFLQYMLERVMDFPNILELNTDVNRDHRLFNLLLFIFPYYLKTALRKGTFKTYIRYSYNDSNIKGAIDIAGHIKKNTPFAGNIAYSQREFSFDNHLMELIRHAIEFIKTKPYGYQLLRKVRDEVASVVEATSEYAFHDRRKVVDTNKKKPIRHAYYHEYRALQNLCIMILQYEKHQVGSGVKHIHGILFDGSWLWEQYVNMLVSDGFYHPMNKTGVGVQQLFTNMHGNKEGRIYPDFISIDDDHRVIADAKYKPATNIGNKDYLQVLAYMFRFDAMQGYYLYPENGESRNQVLYLNQGSTYKRNVKNRNDIWIMKCGLAIPDSVHDYEAFKMAMRLSEESFKLQLLPEKILQLQA